MGEKYYFEEVCIKGEVYKFPGNHSSMCGNPYASYIKSIHLL